jgi:Protein of unknown function (DUF2817)
MSGVLAAAAVYDAARRRFRAASAAAGATLDIRPHPSAAVGDAVSPSVDVARIGPAHAPRVVIVVSGTHGAEGGFGSACQSMLLEDGFAARLPSDTALLLVHAINPHGFAQGWREDEDNVDLNRNFVDFDAALPESPAYASVHGWAVPSAFHGEAREAADAIGAAFVARHGYAAFQSAVTAGQYVFPDGLFFGGQRPSWSNRAWRSILADHASRAARLIAIDLHTGLGAYGAGTSILLGDDLDRARALLGPELQSLAKPDGLAASSIRGTLLGSVRDVLPAADATLVALEVGTVPMREMLDVLRAASWLRRDPIGAAPFADDIRRAVRAAFDPDDSAWRAAALSYAQRVFAKLGAALA